jgi:DNA polymerase
MDLLDELLAPQVPKPSPRLASGDGKPDAPIFIVGECWGEEEERRGHSFSGRSGEELSRMLNDAGLMRSECFLSNVINARPPGNEIGVWFPETKKAVTSTMVELHGRWVHPIVLEGLAALKKEISLVRPRLILALGNTALFALCRRTGITRWRGSLLDYEGIRVVPTYNPAAVLRMWEWRKIVVHDFARAARELATRTPEPEYKFILGPEFWTVIQTLDGLYLRAEGGEELTLDFDIETVKGHIRCFAISWSRVDALCVPLMVPERVDGYWTPKEEASILWCVYKLFTHPRVKLRGQNLLYDFQYVYRHWHFIPNLGQDTMLSHHVAWAGLPKSLLFQASMYCEYFVNWKDLVKHNEEKEGA